MEKYKFRRTFLFSNTKQIEDFLDTIDPYTKNIVAFGETVVIEDYFSFALCRKIANLADYIRLKDPYAIEKSGLSKNEREKNLNGESIAS